MLLLRFLFVLHCYMYVANIYNHTHINVNHYVANVKWFFLSSSGLGRDYT